MATEVGSIIAESKARQIECAVCMGFCEPVMIDRRTAGRDHFERLRCGDWATTFRRVWIEGYAR